MMRLGAPLLTLGLLAGCGERVQYDVVLAGGRVMDPESGLDAVRHVGIIGDSVAVVSQAALEGRTVIDATGLVVAPGFIDLHAHGQSLSDNGWQVRDGVTSALEMERGAYPIDEWYASRAGKALIHYGATVGHGLARYAFFSGARTLADVSSGRQAPEPAPAWSHEPIPVERLDALAELVTEQLEDGGLGIGMGIAYTPAATPREIYRLFEVAAGAGVPIYVHTRGHGPVDPGGSVSALQEVLANAVGTGAPLHIAHLGSSGLAQGMFLWRMVAAARARGLDVTTEVYPYTAGSTLIQTAMFDPGWQTRLGIEYGDLQWPATNERLTEATFRRYRAEGGWVILHMIPEWVVDSLVSHPDIMIASDGVPIIDGRGHPRGVGTYARVLGRYVRERQLLSLMDAIRKSSYLPAERVRGAVPAMARKGRIRPGADADLVLFDPESVLDQATFDRPAQASAGIRHVLVSGTFVVRDGELIDGVAPGRPIRRAMSRP